MSTTKQTTIRLTKEAEAALIELGLTAELLVYQYFGLDVPKASTTTDTAMFLVDQLTVLCWEGSDDLWYCLAPSHPYLCSVAESRSGAEDLVRARISELLSKRDLSKIELALARKTRTAYQSLETQKGKTGVIALGHVLVSMCQAYGFNSKEYFDGSYLLACALTLQSGIANESSKNWAETNIAKYVFSTEAIEEIVQELQ